MLEIKKNVPATYYNNSRDFQLIGRTLEVVLNYINMNIDNMRGTFDLDNIDTSLVELLLTTLAFEPKHNYQNVDLVKLAQIFKKIMRIKGTKEAINEVVYILLRSQRVEEKYIPKIANMTLDTRERTGENTQEGLRTYWDELYSIELFLPEKLRDLDLIDDLFDYILPAGYIYTKRGVAELSDKPLDTELATSDTVTITKYNNGSKVTGQISSSKDVINGEIYTGITYKGMDVEGEPVSNIDIEDDGSPFPSN